MSDDQKTCRCTEIDAGAVNVMCWIHGRMRCPPDCEACAVEAEMLGDDRPTTGQEGSQE